MKQGVYKSVSRRIAFVCAGSNVTSIWGNPLETIRECSEQLSVVFDADIDSSRCFATPAFPAGSGPEFVNAAFRFETELPAKDILAKLHEIEAKAERTREQRWAARTLDLDLIALGEEIAPDSATWRYWYELSLEQQSKITPEQLILPHPRVQDRAFALMPLADVAGNWIHPVLGQDIDTMLSALSDAEKAEVKPLE